MQGEVRRGRVTPALAPRMPVITEDVLVGKLRPEMRHSTAKGHVLDKSRLNEEKENTGGSE